jgi:hypothetical protein
MNRLSEKDFPVKPSRDFVKVKSFREKYSDGIVGLFLLTKVALQ